MGRSARVIPKRLGEKLRQIRLNLEIETFEEMIRRLDCPETPLHPSGIYLFEANKREPTLNVLLKYARLAGVSMDVLVDDNLDLGTL
jgi:transcriptional regulator with XRE-family HTH domain